MRCFELSEASYGYRCFVLKRYIPNNALNNDRLTATHVSTQVSRLGVTRAQVTQITGPLQRESE